MRRIGLASLLVGTTLFSACTADQVVAVPDAVSARAANADSSAAVALEVIAHAVSLAMKDPGFRSYVHDAMVASVRDRWHSLDLTTLLTSDSSAMLRAASFAETKEAARVLAAARAAARTMPELELLFEYGPDRAAWTSETKVLTLALGEADSGPILFGTDAQRVSPVPSARPTTPVLKIRYAKHLPGDEIRPAWRNYSLPGGVGTYAPPKIRMVAGAGGSRPLWGGSEEEFCINFPEYCEEPVPPTPPGGWNTVPAGVYVESLQLTQYDGDDSRPWYEDQENGEEIEIHITESIGDVAAPNAIFRCAAEWRTDSYSLADRYSRASNSYNNPDGWTIRYYDGWGQYAPYLIAPGLLMSANDLQLYADRYNIGNNPWVIQIWEDDSGRQPFRCLNETAEGTKSSLNDVYKFGLKPAGFAYKAKSLLNAANPSPISWVLLAGDFVQWFSSLRGRHPDEFLGATRLVSREPMSDGTTRLHMEIHRPSAGGLLSSNGTLVLRVVGVNLE